jgi:MarR family transcriptional regulator, transcriptional regulator for hemolysin
MGPSPTFAKALPLGYLISEVAKLMKRRFEEEARIHGITMPQWRALAELSLNNGMSQVELAGCIDTDPMTLSGILDRLEKRGLVERSADPNDSRAKRAVVTPAGHELMLEVRRVGHGLYEHAIHGLSSAERQQLIDVLGRMKDNLLAMNAEQKELAQ